LSPGAAPGRVRGRPVPRRAMRTWPSSGMNGGQSPCWPGVRISVTGRHRRSATRWILVVSPPRERPRASRPGRPAGGFLSYGRAPPGQFRGPGAPGPGRVRVRADHGGIRAHRPVRAVGLVAPGPQDVPDPRPGPIQRPAAMPPIDGAPVPEPRGQVPPRAPGPGPEQDPLDHHPVVIPAMPLPRMRRQQRRQPAPLLIGQGMTIQQIIHLERSTPAQAQDLCDTP
jgi:hypothetical protein